MQKTWQILHPPPRSFIDSYPEIDPIVLSILYHRGITTQKEINKFLEPNYNTDQYDPFLFLEMENAVKRILRSVKKKEKVLIYGDYDADGVCSSGLLYETLHFLGCDKQEVYLPHRELEGYGLNLKAVEYIKKKEFNLVITVDCGTTNILELKTLKQAKIDVIILDHHSAQKQRPPVFSFINPKFKKENYPFKHLSAAGVVFKLMQALLAKCSISNFSEKQKESFLKWSLDLVAIATVADMMPLLDENRTLLKWGLVVLNKTKRIGLRELFKTAGLSVIGELDNSQVSLYGKIINTYEIGFMIAPRLNAAGRMNHANTAFKLLITKNHNQANSLAQELNQANQQRQDLTKKILAQAEKQAQYQIKKGKKVLIIVAPFKNINEVEKLWPVSIIGLVAGKISDKYNRPCFLITKTTNGDISGSGRSIENFNIIEAVLQCQDVLTKFGGHPGACGFTLKKEENILIFIDKINKIADKSLKNKDLKPKAIIEIELNFADLNYNLLHSLQKLEPFGQNNPEPLFISRTLKVVDLKYVGKEQKHLVLKLSNNNIVKRAVGFSLSHIFINLKVGDIIDIIYKIKENTYNCISELQIIIEDIKIVDKI